MKRLLFLSVLVLALIAMLVAAGPVAAKATRIEFTACEEDLGLVEGEWTYPGPNMHLRGRIHYFYDHATEPRVTGLVTVIADANFNEDFIGTAWGTFTLVPEDPEYDGGYWEGIWVGPDDRPEIRLVAHGQGEFKGLELREIYVWGARAEEKCPQYVNPGYIEGYILDPGK
jgi:hypothetical protein